MCILTIFLPANSHAAPSIAKDQKVVMVVEFIRHGDRNPWAEIPNAPYAWDGGLSALTKRGIVHEEDLGEILRKEYVDELKLLPKNYEPQTLYVRSTKVDRTIASAKALLEGLYPASFRQGQEIPIHTEEKANDNLLTVHPQDSKAATEKIAKWKKVYWSKHIAKLQTQLAQWSKLSGMPLTNFDELDALADNLYIRRWDHIAFPDNMTLATANEIIHLNDAARLAYYALPEVNKPIGSNILHEVQKLFAEAMQNKSSLKYVLYFTHDETLISLLSVLGVKVTDPPGFAARVDFSLIAEKNTYIVQVNYDGNPIHAKYCDVSGCTLKEWSKLVAERQIP